MGQPIGVAMKIVKGASLLFCLLVCTVWSLLVSPSVVGAADYTVTVETTAATIGEGATANVVTVRLNSPVAVGDQVLVDWRLEGGTAEAPADFTAASGALTFNEGDSEQVVSLATQDDAVVEGGESVFVVVENPRYGAGTGILTGGADTRSVTITDNDTATLSIAAASAGEESGSLSFTVGVDNAVAGGFTVDVSFADGTATGGTDYNNATQTLTFAGTAGESQTLTVPVTNDAIVEGNETFTVTLAPSTASVTGTTATGTITNADTATLSIAAASAGEESGSVSFTVGVDNAVAGGFTVNVSFTDGTATGGTDYNNAAQTLTFAGTAGESQTLTVPVTNDAIVEGNETFTVTLTPSTTSVAGGTATGTIINTDYNVTLSAGTGGTVSGGGVSAPPDATFIVSQGDTPAITIAPATCQHIVDVLVNGASQGAITAYTLPAVTADQAVSASFAITPYTITANVLGGHGNLSQGTQTVNCGATPGDDFTATAEAGYHISRLTVDGAEVAAAVGQGTYTHTFGPVTADQAIEVAFSQKITVKEDSPFGTIVPRGDDTNILNVEYGSDQAFTVNATSPCPEGLGHNGRQHHISELIVDGTPVTAAEGQGEYIHTFTNITQDHTIEALFTSFVDVTVGANGKVEVDRAEVSGSPDTTIYAGMADSVEVRAKDTVVFKAVPNAGFHIAEVKVNGVNVGTPESYTFEALLDDDSTYEVTFSTDKFVIEPVSRFDTVFDTAALTPPKATTRTVEKGADSSLFVKLNDPLYAVYGVLIDNVSYPIPATGGEATYADFVLTNSGGTYLEVRFKSVAASHRLEVQDFDTSPLSDVPLDARLRPKPASLMFALDDSGSMDWEITTSSEDGLFNGDYYVYSYPNVRRARVYTDNSLQAHNEHNRWKSQWAGVNKMFYNPDVTYAPWPTFTGTPTSQLPAVADDGLAHANIYRPRLHPWHSQDCTAAISLTLGDTSASLSSCDNEHTFPMDDVFLDYEETSDRIIVDNSSAAFSRTGDWDASSASGDYGSGYLVNEETGKDRAESATWTFTPTKTTTYEVFAWWVDTNNRRRNVPYTISCEKCGPTTVEVDQRQPGRQWVKLGEFAFRAGETVTVTLQGQVGWDDYAICADAMMIAPKSSRINIINAHYYTWDDKDNDGVISFNEANNNDQIDVGEAVNEDIYLVNLTKPIEYFKVLDNSQSVSASNLVRVAFADLPATVQLHVPKSDITLSEEDRWKKERQNWADWFSYYRKRNLAATGAVAQVIHQMSDVEIGIRTINYSGGGYENGGYGISQPVLPVDVAGREDRTNRLLQLLYGFQVAQYNTPLKSGLKAVGQYYDDTDASTGSVGVSPYHAREDGDECKQVFTILMTDGYYNDSTSPAVGNADGDNGQPYADGFSNSLADVAMYYFERDLSPMENLVPDGMYSHQHMVTYSVAFGVYGTLNPAEYDFNTAKYPTWPNPGGSDDRYKIDDLWHAAVNGRGKFMSASRPDELVKSLLEIMKDIGSRVGSGSSVSVNGDEMYESINGLIRMFQTTYNSGGWYGDLKAYQVDTVTGEVVTSSPVWSAEEKMVAKLSTNGSGHTDRIIATHDGADGQPFRWANLSEVQKKQLAPYFIASMTSTLTGEHVVDFLRGDKSHEVDTATGQFRAREPLHPLGDFVHSLARYQDDVLYVGGNDGMLHAFRATDTGGGEEIFAYVPGPTFMNLRELADPIYSHQYFVDNTPDTQKIGEETYLVGGLGKGGKGYFCLDITRAATDITSETVLANRVKWEYPAPPATLLTGTTFTFSSGTGTGGDDVITDSAKGFTAANGFVVGESIAVIGANYNDGVNTGTNDGIYKIKKISADGSSLELQWGSLIQDYGNGRDITITRSISDKHMGYSYSRAFFVHTNDKTINPGGAMEGWVVLFGNGYGSENGTASLYILDPVSGALLRRIDTKVGPFNGLSTPNAVDVNNDLLADYVYAGDLLGNMWKFDLTATNRNEWQVAYCDGASSTAHCLDTVPGMVPQPLFAGLPNQPITAAPDIMRHQSRVGYMVIFGTGKYLGEPDLNSLATQSLYGIWDWAPDALDDGYNGVRVDVGTDVLKTATLSNWPETDAASGLATHTLLRQISWVEGRLTEDTDGDGSLETDEDVNENGVLDTYSYYRITSNFPGDWTLEKTSKLPASHRWYNKDIDADGSIDSRDKVPMANVGWMYDLPGKIDFEKDGQDNDGDTLIDEAGERILGERVVNDAIIRDGKAILISFGLMGTRCNAGAYSFLNERNAQTGGMLYRPVYDLNGDGKVNEKDMVNIQVPYDANGDGTVDSGDVIGGIPTDQSFEGRLFNPAILRKDDDIEKKYFSSSQGGIQVVDEDAEVRGMSFWQQVE